MYRLNEAKLLAELVSKAERMVFSGLPASMEERFIRRALETPLAIVKRQESTSTVDSNSTAASAATEITVPEDPISNDAKDLHHLLRLRTALSYMLSSYVPAPLARSLTAKMASEMSPVDFKPLDSRLTEVAQLRAEALAARSFGDFSRKRNIYEEDDMVESRVEKKKRIEEEEKKKKAAETRGIRDLKKVDTKGMKKMSDFFGKAAAKKK